MDVLDYVEAVSTQHQREREREWLVRFHEQHPRTEDSRTETAEDARWVGFIHRWTGTHPNTQRPVSAGSDLDPGLVPDREIDR